ncbi:MAG: calcium-binding protein [Cyanobacteria bacterium P01_F01_bin.56]
MASTVLAMNFVLQSELGTDGLISELPHSASNDTIDSSDLIFAPNVHIQPLIAERLESSAEASGQKIDSKFEAEERIQNDVFKFDIDYSDIFKPCKKYIYGTNANDSLAGTFCNDVIYGYDGSDKLEGLEGHDEIYGGDDQDWLWGDEGNDYLDGGAGNDLLYGYTGNDTLVGGIGNDDMSGSTGNDVLFGGYGYDELRGQWDDDWLFGEHGNDYLSGGTGNDYLSGGYGNDTLQGGADRDTLVGGAGNDLLRGHGGLGQYQGSGYFNVLTGDDWNSVAGQYVLGDGADTFVMSDFLVKYGGGTGFSTIITDFNGAEGDKIQVHDDISTYSLGYGNLAGSTATDTFIYYQNHMIGVVQDTMTVNLVSHFIYI